LAGRIQPRLSTNHCAAGSAALVAVSSCRFTVVALVATRHRVLPDTVVHMRKSLLGVAPVGLGRTHIWLLGLVLEQVCVVRPLLDVVPAKQGPVELRRMRPRVARTDPAAAAAPPPPEVSS
jgi:hypothetical protein